MSSTSASFVSQLSPDQSIAIGDVLRFSHLGKLEVFANLCSGVVRTPPGQVPLHLTDIFEVSAEDISTFVCKIEDVDSVGAADESSIIEIKQLLPMGAFIAFLKKHATALFLSLSLSQDSRLVVITSYDKCGGAYVNLSGFTLHRQAVVNV